MKGMRKPVKTGAFVVLMALTTLSVLVVTTCENPLQDIIEKDLIVTNTYKLTISSDGDGNTDPSGTLEVEESVETEIAATPADGWQFDEWTIKDGEGVNISDKSKAETTITLTDGDASIRAVFSEKPLASPSGLNADLQDTDGNAIVDVVLSWSAVQDATKYQLFRSTSVDGPFSDIFTGSDTECIDLDSGLTDGQTYYYRVSCSAGSRESEMSSPLEVLYDATLPTISITVPADNAYFDTGSFTAEGTAADSSGVDEVEIQIDGGSWVLAGGTTNWSSALSSLSDGQHEITAMVTDNDGKTNDITHNFTVDTGDPTVTIQSPSDGADLNDNTPTISGIAGDTYGLSAVEYRIDSGPYAPVNGSTSWNKTVGPLSDGTYTITVRATDHAGNTATDIIGIQIDSSDPVLTVVNPADDLVTTDTIPSCSGTVSDPEMDKVEIQVDSGSWQEAILAHDSGDDYTWSLSPSVAYGDRTITVRASDTLGNSTSISRDITVLETPTMTSASNHLEGRIDVFWNSVSGSGISYHLYHDESENGDFTNEIGSTTGDGYQWSHRNGCDYRKTYWFKVTAEKDGIETSKSNSVAGYRHGWYAHDSDIGTSGNDPEDLNGPIGIEVSSVMGLLITDTNELSHHQVDRWRDEDTNPYHYESYGSFQSSPGDGFDRPVAVATGTDEFFVIDQGNEEIDRWEYDSNQNKWVYDTSRPKADTAWDMALSSSHIYITYSSDYVWRLRRDGFWSFDTIFGGTGSTNGKFQNPRGITISGGEVFVVDSGNNRVQVFDYDGNYQREFTVADESYGICATSDGYLVVTKPNGFEVYEKDTGIFCSSYFDLYELDLPKGIESDGTDLYVADYDSDTVRRYILQ